MNPTTPVSTLDAPPESTSNAPKNKRPRLQLIRADELQPETINWLWKDWLAAGKFHLLAGRAGTGKTTLALSMAATISAGGTWPEGTQTEPGDVIIWSGEDGVKDTLLPRLQAAGADCRRIRFVGAISDGHGRRQFAPATDVPILAETILGLPSPKLLIIDPIILAVNGDSNKGGDVRRGLHPLADLADSQGIAVLGITHFNKGMAGAEPLDRVTGSLAFGALARIVMGAASSAASSADRRLVRLKSNLGTDEGGFTYNMVQAPVPGHPELSAQTVAWSEPLTGSARELLAEIEPVPTDNPSKAAKAEEWLRDQLHFGGAAVETLKAQASAAGLSWRTVERVKQTLGVKSKKRAMGDGWDWELP